MKVIFRAAIDYYQSRKYLWLKFLIAVLPATAIGLLLQFVNMKKGVDISDVFSDFVNVQISAIAILISFSIAIVTILVSAENPNITKLKATESNDCKFLRGKPLNLFQVLLSNICYNVLVEVIYLIILIIYIFLQLFVPDEWIKWLMAISVFFIAHVLHILLESVGQMYLTFWKYEK